MNMKRFLALLLLLGMAQTTSAEERFAEENGDVNADEAVNISDAVTMFGHLFLGNPLQLPPLRSTDARSGLPDTGQTTCYDTEGNVIDCESGTWPGQDGFYSTGCPSERRFIDNGDGTVTDTCTGLMWQQETADLNADGEVTPTPSSVRADYGPDGTTWQGALQYCEQLEIAGYSDWRLPNARELDSIVDYERDEPHPSIDPVFQAEPANYWTSTSVTSIPDFAAVVAFYSCSEMYHSNKAQRTRFVRAVRTSSCAAENGDVNADEAVDISDAITILDHLFLGNPRQLPLLCQARSGLPDTGQMTCYDQNGNVIDCTSDTCAGQDGLYATGCPSEDRFVDNGDGTVTDTCTGLMWQKDTADINGDGEVTPTDPEDASDGATWREALEYCEALEFAGYDDWRLPNGRELESIVDYERLDPCIDPVFGAASRRYWTSSTLVGFWLASGGPEHAAFVGFPYPVRIYHSPKYRTFLVRAVRNAP